MVETQVKSTLEPIPLRRGQGDVAFEGGRGMLSNESQKEELILLKVSAKKISPAYPFAKRIFSFWF